MTSLLVAGIVLTGVIGAAVAALLGPSAYVVCGRGHLLDRIARRVMERFGAGHVDGASANYCMVPSTGAWLIAAAILVGFIAMAIAFGRNRARLSRPAADTPPGATGSGG